MNTAARIRLKVSLKTTRNTTAEIEQAWKGRFLGFDVVLETADRNRGDLPAFVMLSVSAADAEFVKHECAGADDVASVRVMA